MSDIEKEIKNFGFSKSWPGIRYANQNNQR